jgi:hypothetical protein
MAKTPHPLLSDRTWLEARFNAGLSHSQIATEAHTTASNVAYYVRKYQLSSDLSRSSRVAAAIARRFPNGRRGSDSPNWRGGKDKRLAEVAAKIRSLGGYAWDGDEKLGGGPGPLVARDEVEAILAAALQEAGYVR